MLHSRAALLAALTAALACSTPAYSWFAEGHRTVGAIADIILEGHAVTRTEVKILLDNGTLADASTLPDCAKGDCDRVLTASEQESVNKYLSQKKNKKHFEFHYTDVPVVPDQSAPQYEAETAGTEDHDVVQIIRYAIKVLQSKSNKPISGPARFDKRQALWVIAHLVGDIHQPLHVGAVYLNKKCDTIVDPNKVGSGEDFGIGEDIAGTIGGNDILLATGGNMHELWDGTAVSEAMQKAQKSTIQDYAKVLVQSPPTGWETKDDLDSWAEQWADEILPLSQKALTDKNLITITKGKPATHGKKFKCENLVATLAPNYNAWAAEEAQKQLAKAGFRLAALLRAIFENK